MTLTLYILLFHEIRIARFGVYKSNIFVCRTLEQTIPNCGNILRKHVILEIIILGGRCAFFVTNSELSESLSGCSLDSTLPPEENLDHLPCKRDEYIIYSPMSLFNTCLEFGCYSSDRLKRHAAHDRKLVPYDEKLDANHCIYFPGSSKQPISDNAIFPICFWSSAQNCDTLLLRQCMIMIMTGDYRETARVLTHFYSYLYWEKPQEERVYKRIVRDRLHYTDTIFCAAGSW